MPKTKMRGQALLFGLNYNHCSKAHLNGCINDIRNMKEFLSMEYDMPIEMYSDDTDLQNTSGVGILSNLYRLACDSYRNNLDFVYIHYSGHGSTMPDVSGDEADGVDEALVPSDFETKGLLCDDHIQSVFRCFNPNTKILCVFDCCHSGTIGDIKYKWLNPTQVTVENINCQAKAKIITISGCMDTQTSADAFNVNGEGKYSGALTSCIINVLKAKPEAKRNVFLFIDSLREKLRSLNYAQIPQLCSTFNIHKDNFLFPRNNQSVQGKTSSEPALLC